LIPAGTGLPKYREKELWVEGYTGEDVAPQGTESEVSTEAAA
jgi:hypothetical protein